MLTDRVVVDHVDRDALADREKGSLAQFCNAVGVMGGVAMSVKVDERLDRRCHATTLADTGSDRNPLTSNHAASTISWTPMGRISGA